MINIYRKAYGVKACASICFNHESPRRGLDFVTRKITNYIGELIRALKDGNSVRKLSLGNINSYRDWSAATDCVDAFWLMLQQENPKDYVVSSMQTHSVKDFLELAFLRASQHCPIEYMNQVVEYRNWVEIDPKLYREVEVEYLKGDSTPLRNELGWTPKMNFQGLVNWMVDEDVKYHAEKRA